jgi:hypothetical protein
MADGRVLCVPLSATQIRIYDPYADRVTLAGPATFPASNSFAYGVLMPDGRILMTPFNATSLRIYDPVTDTVTLAAGTLPGANAVLGASLLMDGRMIICAYSGTQARTYGRAGSTYNQNVILSGSFYNRS